MKIDLLNKAQLSIINKNNLRYPLAHAEKDYFLAIVMRILYSSPLGKTLVFKGGTAIYHIYLEQLRFSEDLDFGTIEPVTLKDLQKVFSECGFLEMKKVSQSNYSLKVDRLKFFGPLGQPNSLKIDIDLTQKVLLTAREARYRNVFGVPVEVVVMDLVEICAEKVRAINERARYRDFYDLAMVFKKKKIDAEKIMATLKRKELRKELSAERIASNLEIALRAREHATDNLLCVEEVENDEIQKALNRILPLLI